MLDVSKVFDAYSLRARLFPAIVAAAPALAALALLISWRSFDLSTIVATLALTVLLSALADLTRRRGRAIERALFDKQGGKPSIVMFRRGDATIEEGSKERYRRFLGTKLGIAVPTRPQEEDDQKSADSFYEQCGVWLRNNTRDTKKFSLLFNENVTYGFRRNLLGVKWVALGLNSFVVCICLAILWRGNWAWGGELQNRVAVVLIVAAAHAVYVLTVVNRAAVWDAATAYGRELILSCEGLLHLTSHATPKSPTRRRGTQPKREKTQ
jgi:hypothetical protein